MGVEPQQIAAGHGVLGRVLCGVDGSPAGREAVRQGVRLRTPDGRLLLASVANSAAAPHADVAVALEERAAAALQQAAREADADCESHFLVGDPVACLLAAARDYGATLVAVGSHGTSRLGGILAGSVATAMLHRAACSVLVARPPRDSRRFPERIAVGYDGSAAAVAALTVALELGARLDAPVVAVVASGAAPDFEVAGVTPSKVHVDERQPVDALLDAATSCDLLILGARGLRGLRALGSVSERVAHAAPTSVLVVRPAAETIQGRVA